MKEYTPCPFGNTRCLCRDCIDNGAYDDCKSGFCISCDECDHFGKQMHDVYLCTGHESRLEAKIDNE